MLGGSDDGDEGDRGGEWGGGRERGWRGGRFGKEGRVSSSCNAIDPVAVHHVDTILVRSFQIAGVVGVGFCAITSVAGPTHACTHARHAHTYGVSGVGHVYAGCTRARTVEGPRDAALKERVHYVSWEHAPSEMRCRLREIRRYILAGNIGGIYATNDSESL